MLKADCSCQPLTKCVFIHSLLTVLSLSTDNKPQHQKCFIQCRNNLKSGYYYNIFSKKIQSIYCDTRYKKLRLSFAQIITLYKKSVFLFFSSFYMLYDYPYIIKQEKYSQTSLLLIFACFIIFNDYHNVSNL